MEKKLYTTGTQELYEEYPRAALTCLLGVLLKIILSDPLLHAMGINYSGEANGNTLEKIHIGSYVIYLAFGFYLYSGANPISQLLSTFKNYKAYSFLLITYIVSFVYWLIRDPVGIGLLIDTHIPVVICAIVLSHAPQGLCRKAIFVFLVLASINSVAGMIESIWRFRIFSFDPDWVVLRENNFRASAILGHPLNNAMFTAVVLPIAIATRLPLLIKSGLIAILFASLVAFGGRAGLVFSLLTLGFLSFESIKKSYSKLNMLELILLISAILVVPVILFGGLYVLISSSIGERLMAFSSFDDDSAGARWIVFQAFDFMRPEEIFFGISTNRIMEITDNMGLYLPFSDIENPWIIMFMLLGAVLFPVWLLATFLFAKRLMANQPLALKMALFAYFITASASNSFGRKDSIYTIMVAAVVCAGRGFYGNSPVLEQGKVSDEGRHRVSDTKVQTIAE